MTEGTQRRLAAIVAIDVAGYPRLMGVEEEGTLAALKGRGVNRSRKNDFRMRMM